MSKNKIINVKGTAITVFQGEQSDYISLTDIARHKDTANTDAIIQNWLRNRQWFGNFKQQFCRTAVILR